MRKSRQREAVWEWICDRHDHPTAEQVYTGVREIMPQIGLATVYRNLAALEESGMLRSVDVGDGVTRYDPLVDAHAHLLCRECGRVIDIFPEGEMLTRELATLPGVGGVDKVELCLHGVCADCAS